MDNLRFLLAIVLAIGVIIVTNLLFAPGTPPAAEAPADSAEVAPRPAPEGAATTPGTDSGPAAAAPDSPQGAAPPPAAGEGPVADAGLGALPADTAAADTIWVTSPLYRFGVTTAGGGIVSAEMLEFASFTHDGPVQLVPEGDRTLVSYGLQVGGRAVDLAGLRFRSEVERLDVAAAEGAVLRLEHTDAATGVRIVLAYTFRPDSYLVDVEGVVRGAGESATLLVRLGPSIAVNEADTAEDRRSAAYVVNGPREGINSVRLDDVEAQRIEEGPLFWVAVRSKYFLAAALSPCEGDFDCFGGAIAEPLQATGVQLTGTLPVRDGGFTYGLFLGPQEPKRLAALGRGLSDVNPVGWRVFRPILRPLTHLVTWMLVGLQDLLGLGYGWVLILFGFLVRIVLWPLNAKAMRSQLKNMEVQPIIKDLQTRYKDNPEKLQKEMLRLYKEEGFNPFGGCLPMLIPFPVLITLFFVFQNTIEFRGVEFLWLPDLSRPDPLYILPLILGVSMFALQWLSARSMPQDNPQMKMMMWIMPGFITFFFLNLASGLNLYYAASNVASLPQQFQIMAERRKVRARMPPPS